METVPGFPAQEFIDGIHLAMSLGTPVDPEDRATFYQPDVFDTEHPADSEGVGFDPEHRPDVAPGRSDQVPCAVEYLDASGVVLSAANIIPSQVRLTLLGPDYEVVKGFRYVRLGREKWFYKNTQPPLAMDVVPVWQIICTAEDDA